MFEQMVKQIKVFWILVKLKIHFFGVVMVFDNRHDLDRSCPIVDKTILKRFESTFTVPFIAVMLSLCRLIDVLSSFF